VSSDDTALRELSSRIPDRWLNAYDSAPATDDPPVRSAAEALARLERVAGVVRLQHIELVPGLRAPLTEVINEGDRLFTPGEHFSGLSSVLYVGAATSSAEFHVDLHHNLFLHLRGPKRFSLGLYDDPRQAQDRSAGLFGPSLMRPQSPDHVVTYDLEPGDGLYIPPFTLHRVESSDDVTVSLACSWATTETLQRISLQRANGYLQRLRLRSAPPGRHPTMDRTKLALLPALDRAAALVQRRRASAGPTSAGQ
jgi:hypothetical protein